MKKSCDSIVDATLHKRSVSQSSRSLLLWALLNLIFATLFYIDLNHSLILEFLNVDSCPAVFWYTECFLIGVFLINTLVDLFRYIFSSVSLKFINISDAQRKLLAVEKNEPGFIRSSEQVFIDNNLPDANALSFPYSPSNYNLPISPSSSFSFAGSFPSSPVSPLPDTPFTQQANIGMSRSMSPAYLGVTGSPVTPSSGMLQRSPVYGYSPGASVSPVNSSINSTYHSPSSSRLVSGSPNNSQYTENQFLSNTSLRSRFNSKSSPAHSNDLIKDMDALNKFLKEEEDKEQSNISSLSDRSVIYNNSSFWHGQHSPKSDYSLRQNKFTYQIACRSPTSVKSTENDPEDFNKYESAEIWNHFLVSEKDLNRWTENLRKWLSQTILHRLVQQIDSINNDLVRLGSEELQIGEVSISILKQVAVSKGCQLHTLNYLIPFLEVSSNQEYLVTRLKELSNGGCISSFRWNGGGSFKGRPWEEHLPTDAEILMHLFCTYMDSRLPSHPKYPNGKTFTSQHFLQLPDVPDLTKIENLLLYQSKINPPHYKVIIADDTYNLQKGRNNLFHSIILFLCHIKDKECGMLGRINMGLSGVNILWILDRNSDNHLIDNIGTYSY